MKGIIALVTTRNQDVIVEIINVFKAGDGRQIATVEALPVNGKKIRPFTEYSMGGPVESSSIRIQLAFVKIMEFAPVPTPAEVGSL
jgi:hypothetical protein